MIQEVDVMALLDTGSEVTCLSERFYDENKQRFEKCPILPVVGTLITAATGLKLTRLKKQIMVETKIGNIVHDIVY